MAAIRSTNTGPERLIFHGLRKQKIYFRRHYSVGRINIDVALPKRKLAIFIDGDFWHGYNFKKLQKRLSEKYWLEKITKNIERDKKNRSKLKRQGWKVLIIWEHEIDKDLPMAISKIQKLIGK